MKKPQRETFLSFARPRLDEAEIASVVEVLRSGWITTGPKTVEFQKRFASYVGAAHAQALSSCTAGLFLALKLLDIGPGDEVILPPMTFAATGNVIVHCGALPVFADVEPATGLLDPAAFEAAITPRTKAVIPVHLYGRACSRRIAEIARARGIAIVADCAHATETRRQGAHVALEADLAAFSFYATKNLVTGEGGMLTTNSAEFAARAEILSLHGMSRAAYQRYSTSGYKPYEILEAGYKFNMTDTAAALGLGQLDRLDAHLKRREEIWRRYDEAFRALPLDLPPGAPEGEIHARHLYTLRARPSIDRDRLLDRIQSCGVGVSVFFTALHLQPFYRDHCGSRRGICPAAEAISDTVFSVPFTPYLSDEDVEDVIAAVRWAVD